MARVDVPVTAFKRGGNVLPSPMAGDVANGHRVPNDGAVGLIVTNSGTTVARDITFIISSVVDGQPVTPRVVSIAQNTARAFGPFPAEIYGAWLEFTVSHAELTVRAVRF